MLTMPTNCPHQNPRTCQLCLKCFHCREEEWKAAKRQEWTRFCQRERHTFMNLSAPCGSCQELIERFSKPRASEKLCSVCNKPRSEMSELERVLTSGPVSSSSLNRTGTCEIHGDNVELCYFCKECTECIGKWMSISNLCKNCEY
jgi:hypothetical protein